MPKILLLPFFFFSINSIYCQRSWTELSGKQKAFFYQLTRKIENFKPEVFHLFEFTDSIPYINDTLPDFPFVESQIENDSSRLICHFSDMSRKNRGLLMDIGVHFATWELDLILQFKDSEKPKYQYLKPMIKEFERLVLENAPSAAAKMWSEDGYALSPQIAGYYSPNLTINEKIAALKNSGYNTDEKLSLLQAIYKAQDSYIKTTADEIVTMLTGNIIHSKNFLVAAGDGKEWSELESVVRTKYNRPLPDPKAFFSYQLDSKRQGESEEKTIEIGQYNLIKMSTANDSKTNLHIDVWAYHPERQTTIIIQKGGNSYALFGNNDNRYVSADSTFGEGVTYYSLINELENVWIADLKERIYGKKGFDYLIALYEKKIVKTKVKIKRTELKLNHLRHNTVGPPKMKKKKKSRKQRKKGSSVSYQDNQGTPRGKLTGQAKKMQTAQHELVSYEGQLQTELSTLRQLKKEKEEAFDLLAQYEDKLDKMKKNFGYNLMSYTEDKNGYCTFSDGTTFDRRTQDLSFMSNGEADYFEVILVSFGKNVMDENFEEVFVHLNLSQSVVGDVYTLLHEGKTPHSISPHSITDSIQMQELFLDLSTKKSITTRAKIELEQTESDTNFTNSVINYIEVSDRIYITLTGICNQFQPNQSTDIIQKLKITHPNLALNKIASAIDTKKYLEEWKAELKIYAEEWIADTKIQKRVLKNIGKIKLKTVEADGETIKI